MFDASHIVESKSGHFDPAQFEDHYEAALQDQIYAVDALIAEGDDLRQLPQSMRNTNLARLLARRPEGIFVSDFEQERSGRICSASPESGLECLVSKHRARPAIPELDLRIELPAVQAIKIRDAVNA